MKSHLPAVEGFLEKIVPGRSFVIKQLVGRGCNALVFRARSEDLNHDVACKIIPKCNLHMGRSPESQWRREIHAANQINSSRVVKIFDEGDWDENHIFLLANFIKGESLRDYTKNLNHIDIHFIVDLLRNMLDFLRELRAQNLSHGDLHDGNIIVEDRAQALVGRPREFRITDFGVAPLQSDAALLDDFDQLTKIIADLLGKVRFQDCNTTDRLIYKFLRDDMLAKSIPEKDPTYSQASRDPIELFNHLEIGIRNAQSRGASQKPSAQTLVTPFEFLSCEQIGDSHSLLKELYSDKMLGVPQIEERSNLVLTGPRGCGKTTVLRSMSLKHRALTGDALLESIRYLGIYYRCDDLYFAFPRYKISDRDEAINIPMHFVVSTLLREVCEALQIWGQQDNSLSFKEAEELCVQSLWRNLELEPPRIPNANTISALISRLDKERERASKKQRFVNDLSHPIGRMLGPETLLLACRTFREHFSLINHIPFYFLIDDYSSPRITPALQQNLNRLFMQRSADCFFKLATESPTSYESQDIDGKTYVEGREFTLTNLGINFITASTNDKLKFMDDVFDRRFRYSPDFPVKSLSALLGDTPSQSYDRVAHLIRQKKNPFTSGRKSLSELCSGDVHFLIELVGKMVSSAGGIEFLKAHSQDTPVIRPEIQDTSIKKEAGLFLQRLKMLPRGRQLVSVVESFANVAYSYLYYRSWPNGRPHQASRIDRYEDPEFCSESKKVYDELLRYSVFIEDTRGRSRKGSIVPRLYLRRFLIPFFNLTFSKRDTVELGVSDFRALLLDPEGFTRRKRITEVSLTSISDSLDGDRHPQLSLELALHRKKEG